LAEKAAKYLARCLRAAPEVAVVLGSGWRGAADGLGELEAEVPSGLLPGFVQPSVPGHMGQLRMLRVKGRPVLLMLGRVHLYEGVSPAEVVHPVRTAVLAGAKTVVLTNAAGSLRLELAPGELVLVSDHINLTGASPLSGPAPPAPYQDRFVDLSDLYSAELRQAARARGQQLAEGVYAAVRGPHYETPAEVASLRSLGADLVGMSTALEAIAARHLGASVLAISLVTNYAAGISPEPVRHEEVLALGASAAPRLGQLLAGILSWL
jgi:purine-nucleoside phosphorylase